MKKIIPSLLLLLLNVGFSGCSSRGYITSAISTVVGLDVSENPKTQIPHARFGYVRSQYYYIPTDKVAGEASGESGSSKDTPELVSNLFLKSDFLSSVIISEQFAVGDQAVKTVAAQNAFGTTAPTQALAQNPGNLPQIPRPAVPTVVIPTFRPPIAVSDSKIKEMVDVAVREKDVEDLKASIKQAHDSLPQTVRDDPSFYSGLIAAGGGSGSTENGYLKLKDKLQDRAKLKAMLEYLQQKASH